MKLLAAVEIGLYVWAIALILVMLAGLAYP